jgi:hypothetical protein
MIKRFCDCCKAEMTEANSPRFGTTGDRMAVKINRDGVELGVEVLQMVNGTANAGDICKHCILDALYAMDDRPVMRIAR